MSARRRLITLIAGVALLAAVAVPVLAESWAGNSWVSHFLPWHYGHSRSTYTGDNERKIAVDTKLYRDDSYMCGDSKSAIIDGSDHLTAQCNNFTFLSYAWRADGTHWGYAWPSQQLLWYTTSSGG